MREKKTGSPPGVSSETKESPLVFGLRAPPLHRRRASVWRTLPDELKGCCASFLDTPSAGRFAAASREGQRLVLTRLVEEKAALDAAAHRRHRQHSHSAQAAPRRITFSAAGRAFIDEYVDTFRAAAPPQRRHIVESILVAAAAASRLCSTRVTGQCTRSRRD